MIYTALVVETFKVSAVDVAYRSGTSFESSNTITNNITACSLPGVPALREAQR